MENIWGILITLLLGGIGTLGARSNENLVNVEYHAQPGVFFERMPDVSFAEDRWNLVIAVDYKLPFFQLEDLSEKITELDNANPMANENSVSLTRIDYRYKMRQIRFLSKQHSELIKYYECAKSTINYKDLILYYNLWNASREESHIIKRKRLTVVASSMNKINKEILNAKTDTDSTISVLANMSSDHNIENIPMYFQNFVELQGALNNLTKHMYGKISAMQTALQALRSDVIASSLLEDTDFEKILNETRTDFEPSKLPIQIMFSDIGRLKKLIEIKMGIHKDVAFISFSIPMIVNDTAQIYKLNEIPIVQNISNVMHGSALIVPSSHYLLIKDNITMKFNDVDLIECIKDENFTLCPKRQFVFKDQKNCEGDIIMGAKFIDYDTCKIRYRDTIENYFYYSRIANKWVFSIPNETTLRLTCDNSIEWPVKLKGVGTLSFPSYCKILNGKEKLTILNITVNPLYKITIPNMNLNLVELTNIFEDKKSTEIFKEITMDKPWESWWLIRTRVEEMTTNRNKFNEIYLRINLLAIVSVFFVLITLGILGLIIIMRGIISDTMFEIRNTVKVTYRSCGEKVDENIRETHV